MSTKCVCHLEASYKWCRYCIVAEVESFIRQLGVKPVPCVIKMSNSDMIKDSSCHGKFPVMCFNITLYAIFL